MGYVPQGRTGTPAELGLRRYYVNAQHLKKTLRRLQREGLDVERELLGLGSVYVLRDGKYAQIPATEAAKLVRAGPDRSPHHLRDQYEKASETACLPLSPARDESELEP